MFYGLLRRIGGWAALLALAFLARGETPLAASARLIAADRVIRPGVPFTVGIHIRLPEGAHIYYRNPGDAGLPTRVEWTLPPGFTAGPLQWPVPARFAEPPLMSHGYADEVVFPAVITPPPRLDGIAAVRLAARVDWLLCKESCVPGGADVALGFRVGDAPGNPTPDAALLARFVARVPAPAEGWRFHFEEDARRLRLFARAPAGWTPARMRSLIFIPHAEDLTEPAAPQVWRATEAGEYVLDLPKSARGAAAGARLEGILREGDGHPPRAEELFFSVSAPARSNPDPSAP